MREFYQLVIRQQGPKGTRLYFNRFTNVFQHFPSPKPVTEAAIPQQKVRKKTRSVSRKMCIILLYRLGDRVARYRKSKNLGSAGEYYLWMEQNKSVNEMQDWSFSSSSDSFTLVLHFRESWILVTLSKMATFLTLTANPCQLIHAPSSLFM